MSRSSAGRRAGRRRCAQSGRKPRETRRGASRRPPARLHGGDRRARERTSLVASAARLYAVARNGAGAVARRPKPISSRAHSTPRRRRRFRVRHRASFPRRTPRLRCGFRWPDDASRASPSCATATAALPPDVVVLRHLATSRPSRSRAWRAWTGRGDRFCGQVRDDAAPVAVEPLSGFPVRGTGRAGGCRAGWTAPDLDDRVARRAGRLGRLPRGSPARTAASRAPDPRSCRPRPRGGGFDAIRLRRSGRPARGPSIATPSGPSPRTACSRGPSRRRCARRSSAGYRSAEGGSSARSSDS